MFDYPRSFPTQNNFRLVHFVDPRCRDDADRLLQIAADAITDARRAVEMLDDIPDAIGPVVDDVLPRLSDIVSDRRVHTEEFRYCASRFIGASSQWLSSNGGNEALEKAIEFFRCALEGSERVADFRVASEEFQGKLQIHRKPR